MATELLAKTKDYAITLQGKLQLGFILKNLGEPRLQKKILMKGMRLAAKETQRDVKANIKASNKRSGYSASASGVKARVIKRKRKATYFGMRVFSADRMHLLKKSKSLNLASAGALASGKAYYPAVQEYGNIRRGIPEKGTMRNTFKKRQSQNIRTVIRQTKMEIMKLKGRKK